MRWTTAIVELTEFWTVSNNVGSFEVVIGRIWFVLAEAGGV